MKLGIDPGFTTGICVIDEIKSPDDFKIVGCGEIFWSNRFWFKQFFAKHADQLDAIVIEEFKLFKHLANEQTYSIMPSARIIGIAEAFAFEHSLIEKIVYQSPKDIKYHTSYTIRILDAHSKQLGSSNHIRDAYRHLRKHLKG